MEAAAAAGPFKFPADTAIGCVLRLSAFGTADAGGWKAIRSETVGW